MASTPNSCKTTNKFATVACKEPISTVIFFFSISSNCKIYLVNYNITYN